MVKGSDSFFIRATLDADNTGNFQQTSLDLGAYVDALGKSVLRIHNVAVSFTDANGEPPVLLPNDNGCAQYQLTTQSQNSMVLASNRSIIASGTLVANRAASATGTPTEVSHDADILPQMWTNGYLVAVDTIYLGGRAPTSFSTNVFCSITLECTVEKMSEAAAMALALSQQGA